MAGGYTTALIRCLAKEGWSPERSRLWTVGKRGLYCCPAVDLRFREPPRTGCVRGRQRTPSPGNCSELTGLGRSERSICFFTRLGRGMGLEQKSIRLLPLEKSKSVSAQEPPMNFEPSSEEVLEMLVPEYLRHMIHGGILMSQAAENRARMEAMDAAERNAQDMLDDLTLQFNRAVRGPLPGN